MTPKISVVFPIYNNENYVEKCIRSVMNQSITDIELLLIDDGSNDNTPITLDRLACEDKRIKVVHKQNEGSAKARNIGINMAQGEYVAFVESDDSVANNMYESLYNRAKETDAEIVKCGFYYKSGDECKESKSFYDLAEEGVVFEAANCPKIFLCHASIWGGIYLRSFLIDNNLRFIETPRATYSDFSWMAATYAYAKRITIYHKALYYYTYDNPKSSHFMYGKNYQYKFIHANESIKILKEAGIYESVKEYFDYASFVNCVDAVSKISEENRLDGFDLLRQLCDKICNDGLDFSQFNKRHKYMFDLVQTNNITKFYDFVLSRYTLFDYEELKGKRVVLFGAGRVGISFERQLNKWDVTLVKWIDNNPDNRKGVENVSSIVGEEYDYVLIAIYDHDIAQQISKQLQGMEIPSDKILWKTVFELV